MAENILSGKEKCSSAVSHSKIVTSLSLPMCVFSVLPGGSDVDRLVEDARTWVFSSFSSSLNRCFGR